MTDPYDVVALDWLCHQGRHDWQKLGSARYCRNPRCEHSFRMRKRAERLEREAATPANHDTSSVAKADTSVARVLRDTSEPSARARLDTSPEVKP